MNTITEAVLEYLNNSQTLGALQIDGPWGCGKTHYVKHVLLDEIEKNEENRKAEALSEGHEIEKRVPLMISLFGIKSIDDISRQLLFASTKARYGFSEHSIDRIKKGFTNVAKFIPYLKDFDWEKAFSMSPETCIKLLNEDSIIMFDDLERLSPAINIEDILGYINDLVENYNFKVIIISNQKHFKEKASLFKEKVVEKTIPFNIDTLSIVRIMAESYNKLFADYILRKEVVRFITPSDSSLDSSRKLSNLRTIRFAISQFNKVFTFYTVGMSNISDIPSETINKLDTLWRFTSSIAIEYRLGNIVPEKSNNLENAGLNFMLDRIDFGINNDKLEEREDTYEERYIKCYYEAFDLKYDYISSLYDYIVKGSTLDLHQTDVEVCKALGILNEQLDEEHAFTSEFYQGITSLSDDEAPDAFREYLALVSKGQVRSLSDFITATRILNRYKEVHGLTELDIKNRVIIGIDYYFQKADEDVIKGDQHHLEAFSSEYSEQAKEVFDYIRHKFESKDDKGFNEYITSLNRMFESNMDEFANEFIPNPISQNVFSVKSPMLHLMDLDLVEKCIGTLSTKDAETLRKMLYFRFGDNITSFLDEEKPFITAIQKGLRSLPHDNSKLSILYKNQELRPYVDKLLNYNKS